VSISLVLLDVNVPMYAAGQDHPYRQACSWIMMEVADGRLAAAINAETIQEVLYRYGALRQWTTATTMAASLFELVPIVYPVLAEDARLAIELFKRYAPQGLRARDVLHVAVMQNNGLSEIISVDRHFDRVEGIVRLDPQDLFQRTQNPI
jgi:predicted nucleic acid-binding protein